MASSLLSIVDLRTYFFTEAGTVLAVDGISLEINTAETMAFVGESGSGKTVTALSVLRVVPRPGKIVAGKILFKGDDILSKDEVGMQGIRGKEIGLILQDPSTSLNPVLSVGSQLTEVVRVHQQVAKEDAESRVRAMLKEVEIPDVDRIMRGHPHELSGGMKQRIAIARALLCEPSLVIADEPTTNLDATIQAQILELLKTLRERSAMSNILITHDLGIVAEIADRVAIFYAGRVYEVADVESILERPLHPYTMALLQTLPRIDKQRQKLPTIPGNVPQLIDPPSGCRYYPRCRFAVSACRNSMPELRLIERNHSVACIRFESS